MIFTPHFDTGKIVKHTDHGILYCGLCYIGLDYEWKEVLRNEGADTEAAEILR